MRSRKKSEAKAFEKMLENAMMAIMIRFIIQLGKKISYIVLVANLYILSIESTQENTKNLVNMPKWRVVFGGVGLILTFAGVTYLASPQAAIISLLAFGVYTLIASVIVYAVRAIFRRKQPLGSLFVRIFLRF